MILQLPLTLKLPGRREVAANAEGRTSIDATQARVKAFAFVRCHCRVTLHRLVCDEFKKPFRCLRCGISLHRNFKIPATCYGGKMSLHFSQSIWSEQVTSSDLWEPVGFLTHPTLGPGVKKYPPRNHDWSKKRTGHMAISSQPPSRATDQWPMIPLQKMFHPWCQGAQDAKQWVPFAAVEKQNLCAHSPIEPNKWLPTDRSKSGWATHLYMEKQMYSCAPWQCSLTAK